MASVDAPRGRPTPATLGPVASSRGTALYVIKIGSASQAHDELFAEIAALRVRNARILLVAGGATGIATHYAGLGRRVPMVVLDAGNEVRHATADEMPHIVAAYEHVTLPAIRGRLEALGLTVHAAVAATGGLVSGSVNHPLKATVAGRRSVVRDHRAGTVRSVGTDRIGALLAAFDVVCLSPPIADEAGGTPLNVDADVLAAALSNALDADHLRLVTTTPGLLRDPADPASRIADVAPGEGSRYARGRMRQKVRAAEIALAGPADVAICGPHALSPLTGSRFWKATPPAADMTLLSRAVEIASVSGDERELAEYLAAWATRNGIDAQIDPAGNLVATRGSGGSRRLLMLGHLDTVAHRWPVCWDGETLSGRGCVDAKASLILFLQALAAIEPPPGTQVRVVGAVEEESTSAGASYVRDHYPADAVVVGEPSGAGAVTIGYHGLLKVRLRCEHPVGHTAGREALTAADRIAAIVTQLHTTIPARATDALVATLGVHAVNAGDRQMGEAVVDVRVPHGVTPGDLLDLVRQAASGARVEVLRSTPASKTSRADPLVRAFTRALKEEGMAPRFLAKKGSCDINTLATAGHKLPWLAYGPGDASLDHTPTEHLRASEVRVATRVLRHAVLAWLDGTHRPMSRRDDQVPAVAS